MIHGLTLLPPRLLILPRVLHDDQRTQVGVLDYKYDDELDPEPIGTQARTHEYEQRPTSSEDEHDKGLNTVLKPTISNTGITLSNQTFAQGVTVT